MSETWLTYSNNVLSFGGNALKYVGSPGTLTVSLSGTGTGFSQYQSFDVVVTFDSAISYTVNGVTIPTPATTYTATLHKDESVVLGSIPAGTEYIISESNIPWGYSLTSISNSSGTFYDGNAYISVVTNSYNVTAPGAYTLRFKFSDSSVVPTSGNSLLGIEGNDSVDGTWTAVYDGPPWYPYNQNPAWDWTLSQGDWSGQFANRPLSGDYTFEIIDGNTTGVTNMNNMFKNNRGLKSIGFIEVVNPSNMFEGCINLESVKYIDFTRCYGSSFMFKDCTSLTYINPVGTSNIQSTQSMFQGCTGITEIPLFDTSGASNFTNMFQGCTSLVTSPLYNTSNSRDISYMFQGCTGLISVPLLTVSSKPMMGHTFDGCINVESGALALYQSASSAGVSSHYMTFNECGSNTVSGAAELAQIPNNWKTTW